MEQYGERLKQAFYLQDAVTVAKSLIGMHLVHEIDGERLVVEITETEAYTGKNDKASHAYGGKVTPRTKMLYRPGGYAYVYLIYGMYHMLNIVTGPEGDPCAVLIRSVRPIENHDAIAMRRYGKEYGGLSLARRRAMLDGPGKVCKGLGLTMQHNGANLLRSGLYLTLPKEPVNYRIAASKRINIDYAEEAIDFLYRFSIEK